jgi:hypothetical protein
MAAQQGLGIGLYALSGKFLQDLPGLLLHRQTELAGNPPATHTIDTL